MKALRLSFLAYRGFGIEYEGLWQGLMLTSTAGHTARLAPDQGKPVVCLDYIEVAPWNVAPLAKNPKMKGVGIRLFEAAVRQSIDEGFNGRLALHSLRDSEPFYEKLGRTKIGSDQNCQNLNYYEYTAGRAQDFLKKGG